MTDPYTYLLLHRYQRLDRMREAERSRIIQMLIEPAAYLASAGQVRRRVINWLANRRLKTQQAHFVESGVAIHKS